MDTEVTEPNRPNLIKKKNTKSAAWNFFGIEADEHGVSIPSQEHRPICRICYKSVPCKTGNTTNLFTHLRERHPDAYKEANQGNMNTKKASRSQGMQPTLETVVERSTHYDPKGSQAKELNHAVAYFLAKDMQPLQTVEKPGFQKMIAKFNPRYKLPSRKHFSHQEIPRLYNQVKETVVNPKLSQIDFFSATTDLWTSRATHPYLSYTVHFIDSAWGLQSICLETVPLFEDHTGENIIESINDILSNWNLSTDKLVLTATDNGSNFVAGFHSRGWLRLSCFGHCLDLAINKCLEMQRVQRSVRRCNTLVASFSRSWKKQRNLKEKQSQLGLPEHKLVGAVTTRWNSTYDMVERILQQQQALSAVLLEDRKSWCLMLNDADVTVLETFAELVKPLSYLTDALSGEKEVTCSAIRPLLQHVMEICEENDEDSPLLVQMKSAISGNLSPRYESAAISIIIDKCSFLDPRFKANYVADTDLVKSNLLTEMLKQHDQHRGESDDADDHRLTINPQQDSQELLEPPLPKKAKRSYSYFK